MRVGGGMYAPLPELLPTPAPRRHEEDDLQRSIVQFLTVALPDDALCFHIPNGGQRHSKAAARLVGLGVRAGIPDLCVIHRGRVHFLEVKARRGVLSAAQRRMVDKLNYCGVSVMLCRSVLEAEAALREACVPLRASVT